MIITSDLRAFIRSEIRQVAAKAKLPRYIKSGHPQPLFIYFRLFNTVDNKQMFNFNFDNDWI